MQHDNLTAILNMLPTPAFTVLDNVVVECNTKALSIGITPGTDILSIFESDKNDFLQFSDGCLSAILKLHNTSWNATITAHNNGYIFRLDRETDVPEFRSLNIMGAEMRNIISNLTMITDRFSTQIDTSDARPELFKALRTVNNVSNISRFSEDRTCYMQECNICSVVAELMEECKPLMAYKGVMLHYTVPNEPIMTILDQHMFRQSVYNLVDNVLQFAANGKTAEVNLVRRGNYVHFCITDHGPGIKQDVLNTLFTRYNREPIRDEIPGGLGLGLPIVRYTAISHKGTVLVDSPAPGSNRITFTIAIRRASQLALHTVRKILVPSRDDALIMLSNTLPAEVYKTENR